MREEEVNGNEDMDIDVDGADDLDTPVSPAGEQL